MRKWCVILVAAALALSCKMVRESADQLFRGEIVARVGENKLYRTELAKYIPAGVSPEDSAGLAQRYITAWAEELLLLEMAQEQLSPQERDVSAELEEYRRSLLKYRYEQLYINSRLDTLVTEEQMQQYYAANKEKFRLDRPLIKSRYLVIPANSRKLKTFRSLMSSDNDADLLEADSLALTSALKYVDASDTWMDAITLAQELGTDYRTLVKSIKNSFAEVKDDTGLIHLAYIVEMVPDGKPAPLEHISGRVKEIIISSRRHALETSLEEDLMEDAIRNNKLVIYAE